MTTTTPTEKRKSTNKKGTEMTDHPLSKFIPESYFLDDYVGRTLYGVDDLSVMGRAHDMKHNVLIAGPTGAAKTSFVYAYAVQSQMPVINIACNGAVQPEQLLGQWLPKSDGQGYHFVPGELVLGVMHGAIILLNEVNFMPPKIASVIYGLLDRRRTVYLPMAAGSDTPTVIKAHPRTLVVADYNPGYHGTRPLNQAFKNRFAIKLNWDYDHNVETELVTSPSLLELGEKLRASADAGDISTPIPTNMLMEFEDLAYDEGLGIEYAVGNFVAAFEYEEQQVVSEVVALYIDRITDELGLSAEATETEEA
jgi:MoxR-like ATPase